MPSDPSIYGQIKQQPGPLEQYGQVLNLKQLMGQNQLQGLQTQKLTGDMAEETAAKDYLRGLAPGVDPTSDEAISGLRRVAPNRAMQFQKDALAARKTTGEIAHTAAQTGEITAGHIAGAWGALAKGGGSDESVKNAEAMMTPMLGAEAASKVSQKLLAMPPETRLAYAVAQAGQHPRGQEALKLFFPAAHMQDTGGTVTPVSTSTLPGGAPAGTPIQGTTPLAKTQTPDSMAADARVRETLAETKRHHGAVEGDPQTIEDTAQAIAGGRLAPLSGFALNRPMAQNIMARVIAINPEFDPTQFATRQKAEKDFATGKQGQSVKSFNVALSHLETLDQLSDALKNGNTQAINKIGNAISSQTGAAAPANFDAAKKIVADEIVKAIVGSGGGVADREEAAKTINAASSPAQLKGVINTYKELMRGQLIGLRDQYKATTGKDDFDKKYLSESGRQAAHGSPANAEDKTKPGKLVPAKGTVQDGYKFKGGDPAKAESWEKV